MIYTVTLNPTLDVTYLLDEIRYGEPLKAERVIKTPGGKGINVSRALRAMGMDSVAMGLVGGHVGDEFLDRLQEEGLILQMVRIKNDTRSNVVVLGRRDRRELMIKAAGPQVEEAETARITRLLFGIATAPEVLVLSGSLPPCIHDDIYRSLIVEGKSRGSMVILDGSGPAFASGVEAAPHLIKPNLAELEELAGEPLSGQSQIIGFCRYLNGKGVKIVVVSMGADGALLVTSDTVLKGTVPRLQADTVGAGDSMVAGLVAGLAESLELERTFEKGLAFSVAAVMNEGPGLVDPSTYREALPSIAVERLEAY